MRIDGFSIRGNDAPERPSQTRARSPESTSGSAGGPGDASDLSSLARVLTGGDRAGQIEQLRQSVGNGAYQPPAAQVSRRIVDFYLAA
jgi:hypothetical protein